MYVVTRSSFNPKAFSFRLPPGVAKEFFGFQKYILSAFLLFELN